MRKKLLILDIDDTICDAREAYEKALSGCYGFFSKVHKDVDRKAFMKMYAEARKEIHLELSGTASMHDRFLYFQRMSELMKLPFDPETLGRITSMYWDLTYRNLRLFPGVRNAMKGIKESGVMIGLATNLVADVQVKKLEKQVKGSTKNTLHFIKYTLHWSDYETEKQLKTVPLRQG